MEIQKKFRFTAICLGVTGIVLAGIMVPGAVLEANQKSEYDKVSQVPKDYLPSSSVMAKEASANLKLSEKLSLIDGQWDSTTDEAATYEMDEQDYQAVVTARESMEQLYEKKLYPVNLSPDYSNWYTWEAAAYKACDNTFNTYTAYYWVIRFEKYDASESHTIWMLEDGTIVLARAQMKEKIDTSQMEMGAAQTDKAHTDKDQIDKAYVDKTQADTLQKKEETENNDYNTAFGYSGIDFSGMNLINLQSATDEENQESYEILQFLEDKDYVYGIRF